MTARTVEELKHDNAEHTKKELEFDPFKFSMGSNLLQLMQQTGQEKK